MSSLPRLLHNPLRLEDSCLKGYTSTQKRSARPSPRSPSPMSLTGATLRLNSPTTQPFTSAFVRSFRLSRNMSTGQPGTGRFCEATLSFTRRRGDEETDAKDEG